MRAPGGNTGSGTVCETAQTAPPAPTALFCPRQNTRSSQTSPLFPLKFKFMADTPPASS